MKYAVMLALLTGCASTTHRAPAQADQTLTPPLAKVQPTVLYSWTGNAQAALQPSAAIASQIQHAQDCIAKLQHASDAQVAGCEGDELAAGAGFYTVDNPFTSHDYGTVVLSVPINTQDPNVALVTGSFDGGPASGGIGRDITANAKFDGLIYNFRANDLSTRALIVRNANLVDLKQARALNVGAVPHQDFASHAPFKCTSTTSANDVLAHWGDHLEFLSQVFVAFRDPEGTNFMKNGQLNDSGVLAAAISDALSIPDAALTAKVTQLKSKDLKDALDPMTCQETESRTLRSCLMVRFFSTLMSDDGNDRHPTYALSEQAGPKILAAFNLGPGKGSRAEIAKQVIKAFRAKGNSVRQAGDAYACAQVVKASIAKTHLGNWGNDPE